MYVLNFLIPPFKSTVGSHGIAIILHFCKNSIRPQHEGNLVGWFVKPLHLIAKGHLASSIA